jgi:hypothetical protein
MEKMRVRLQTLAVGSLKGAQLLGLGFAGIASSMNRFQTFFPRWRA